MHYYDIYPQIVPADRVSEIRIHPRFSHAAIPSGGTWRLEMRHAPQAGVTEKGILPAYVWADRDGVPLELTAKEFDLLLLLAENAGKTLTKEYLFNRIWGSDSESEPQTLTVHIKRLREKLADSERYGWTIYTVRGVGYKFATDR